MKNVAILALLGLTSAQQQGWKGKASTAWMQMIDKNRDGQVSFDEYREGHMATDKNATPALVDRFFNAADCDRSKSLDEKEMGHIMKNKGCDGKPIMPAEEYFNMVDTNKNGFVDWNEWEDMVKNDHMAVGLKKEDIEKGWKDFTKGDKCIGEKGWREYFEFRMQWSDAAEMFDMCETGRDCKDGCCGEAKITKGDINKLDIGWQYVMHMNHVTGMGACTPKMVIDYMEKRGESTVYDYNEFMFNSDPKMAEEWAKSMGMTAAPATFADMMMMVKGKYPPADYWRDTYFKMWCKKDRMGRGGSDDEMRGRRGGNRMDGEKIEFEMGGTKVMIIMGATKLAATAAAATAAAMTLY